MNTLSSRGQMRRLWYGATACAAVGQIAKARPPDRHLTVPVSIEAFSQAAAAQGFTKCCHAALLDIEARWYGIPAYDVPSALYYEARLSGDLWLYWEADRAGTILAHGVHNSP